MARGRDVTDGRQVGAAIARALQGYDQLAFAESAVAQLLHAQFERAIGQAGYL